MKKARREYLRKRFREELELPSSRLLVQLRVLNDTDWIRIWNEIKSQRPSTVPLPERKPSPREIQGLKAQDRALAERIESVHRRACENGAEDLRALGLTPSELMIHAYQLRLGTWGRIVDVDEGELGTVFDGVTKDADPDLR